MYERFAAPKQLHWIAAADHFFTGALEALEEQVKASAEQRP
jgi:alpha/beta superfamily hydrolase